MNEEQQEAHVADLAKAEFKARTELDSLGMLNTKTGPEGEAQAVEYALAKARHHKAKRDLSKAIYGDK